MKAPFTWGGLRLGYACSAGKLFADPLQADDRSLSTPLMQKRDTACSLWAVECIWTYYPFTPDCHPIRPDGGEWILLRLVFAGSEVAGCKRTQVCFTSGYQ